MIGGTVAFLRIATPPNGGLVPDGGKAQHLAWLFIRGNPPPSPDRGVGASIGERLSHVVP
jgi:hypothetical protein